MASSVGSGLALVIGGALIGIIVASGITEAPVVGHVAPWQLTLIIIGLCGLPLTLLAYAFPDPGRAASRHAGGASFSETWALVKERRVIIGLLLIYSVMQALLTYAIASWLPALLGRDFGLPPQTVGPILGGMLIVLPPIGLGCAGWIMDRSSHISHTGPALAAIIGGAIFPRQCDLHAEIVVARHFLGP